jgi:hypothetical protein
MRGKKQLCCHKKLAPRLIAEAVVEAGLSFDTVVRTRLQGGDVFHAFPVTALNALVASVINIRPFKIVLTMRSKIMVQSWSTSPCRRLLNTVLGATRVNDFEGSSQAARKSAHSGCCSSSSRFRSNWPPSTASWRPITRWCRRASTDC